MTAFLLLAALAGCTSAAAPSTPPGDDAPSSASILEGPVRPVQDLFARTIESIGADGSDRRVLLRRFTGSVAAFSPDGALLAYDEQGTDGSSLHLWDAASGQDAAVLRGYAIYRTLWSADGRWLAVAYQPSSTSGIQAAVLGRDGQLRASVPGHPVAWRPGHPHLLVFQGPDLALLDAEAGEARPLVDVRQSPDRTAGAWSPDGRMLAYVAPAEGTCPTGPGPIALQVLDMGTGQQQHLWGPTCALVLDVAWSREGDRLAVAVTEWAEEPQRGIHMLDLGTGQTTFVPSVGGVDSRLSWLAGGHLLSLRPVCYACDPGYWGLWLFDGQGRALASWGLSGGEHSYAVAADGTRVAIGTDTGELLVMAVGSDGPRRLLDERPFQAFGLSWAGPQRIAFVRGVLWNAVSVLVAADGSGGKALPYPASARLAAVSLASGRAAYVLLTDPLRWTAYVSALDGSNAQTVPQGRAVPLVWSPDGRRLAVRLAQPNGPEVLAVLDSDGRTEAIGPAVAGVYPYLVSWSPDGRRLAWSAQERLWLWDLDSGRVQELGPSHPRLGQSDPRSFVAWSPDGRYLAYDGPEGLTLHELGSDQKRLLVPGHPLAVAWSPDGRELAYLMDEGFGRAAGLQVVSVVSGQGRTLVSPVNIHAKHDTVVLRWSPRGDRLAYVSASPTLAYGAEVMVVDVATGRQESITGPLRCHASLLDWSNDGRWLAVAVDGLCL
ncbi:MAG TPA: hypothetical protein VNL95_09990 [Dehalococcoidia bacterium]|nr:hypothetical protein [Dehalococcoidia bacterium]